MIYAASVVARYYHSGQKYGERDYMYHLDSVYDKVAKLGHADITHRTVALLHDILEDTSCTYEILKREFGKEIARAVWDITKHEGQSYDMYIEQVKGNPISLAVKIADTCCNLEESLKSSDKIRILKYSKQLVLLVE